MTKYNDLTDDQKKRYSQLWDETGGAYSPAAAKRYYPAPGTSTTTTTVAAPTNLLINADFAIDGINAQINTANISAWTSYGSSGWYQNDLSDWTVKLWSTSSGIYQDFISIAGNMYYLSGEIYQTSAEALSGYHASLSIEWYNSAFAQICAGEVDYITEGDPVDTWIAVAGTVQAPVSAAYGRLLFSLRTTVPGNSGSAHFDNAWVS